MKYIYNPITGTLDDVETPNLGEKYFASAETDALKDMMNEQFGPGTIKYGSEIPQPEMKTPQAIYEFGQRNPAANGGMMRQNFVVPGLIFAPQAITAMAAITGLGIEAVRRYAQANPDLATNLLENLKTNSANLKDNVLAFVDGVHGEKSEETKKIEEAGRVETFPIQEDYSASFGGKGTEIPEQTKQEPPVSGGIIEFPPSTGGTEIIEPKKGDNIFTSKSAEKTTTTEYGKKALEEIDSETLTDINTIIKDYKDSKTRKAGIVTTIEGGRKRERFRPASTQPIMNEADKVELIELVINKYKEKENELPSATELKALLPSLNVSSLAKKNKIELGKRTADYDRNDPKYIETQRENKQLKANENNTITNFANENFFPDTVELKDGSTVNAKEFFINNLVKRTELGPSRIGTYDTTLKNKELAKLFNTNIRKIEEVIKNIRNSPDFQADFPEPRPENYANEQAAKTLKDAREYAKSLPNGELHVQNVLIQENKRIPNLNNLFKNETLKITDYPKIVEDLNTTMDKKTGIIDKTITKTEEELIDRSKKDKGIFQVFHNVPKSSKQKNIEFLSNRYISLYKTNAGFVKSAEAYIKNQKDNVDYKERVEDFDNYLKERGLRIKIDNKFYGIDFQEMINSETGEFTGMNRTLEYYGLPKFENGVPLKKIKKAAGGVIPDQEIMNYATGGRVNFQDGTPNPQLEGDDFLNELEFKFNNIDNVTLDDTPITFDDSKSKIAQVADLANPKNIPYYADMAVRAGLRVGEFGARIIPATGNLISDLIQKPLFKVKSSYEKDNIGQILDYDETPENNNVKFVGGPIFKNFLKNITPTSTEKLVGLDTLINEEKKKMIERGSSSLPVKVAETAALGGELIAPIFPGLKLLKAYAKSKSLPVNDDTKQLLEQDVDMVLESNGMDRRQFLQITGTGGAVILAKMLGFGDEFATATKVAEKATAEAVSTYPPPYFFKLVEKINSMGDDITKKAATQEREIVKSYKDYEMTENLGTGEIVIRKRNEGSFYDQDGIISDEYIVYKPGQADELTKGKTPPAEYDEYTVRPDSDGKLRDSEDGLDSIEEILEEVGDPDSLTLKR